MWKWIGTAAAYLIVSVVAAAAEAVTLTGKVTDANGKPIEHATVLVYRAGVKNGYSTLCPTCYADCGKRSLTDAAGIYTLTKLNSELWFELVIVRDGYKPIITKVDPSNGHQITAILNGRSKVDDPRRLVRGRVVDAGGHAFARRCRTAQGFC